MMDPQGSSDTSCNTAVCKYQSYITACTQESGAWELLYSCGHGAAEHSKLRCGVCITQAGQCHCPKPAERLEEMMMGKEVVYGCTAFRG